MLHITWHVIHNNGNDLIIHGCQGRVRTETSQHQPVKVGSSLRNPGTICAKRGIFPLKGVFKFLFKIRLLTSSEDFQMCFPPPQALGSCPVWKVTISLTEIYTYIYNTIFFSDRGHLQIPGAHPPDRQEQLGCLCSRAQKSSEELE